MSAAGKTVAFKSLSVGQRFRMPGPGVWAGLLAVKTGDATYKILREHRGTKAFTQFARMEADREDRIRIGNKKTRVIPLGTGRANPDEFWGEPISSYSRAQAIEDGFLVDVTEWASEAKGFRGGFTVPVAVTASLWSDLEKVPRMQDLRGRAHDVLWMASLAVKGGMKRGLITKHGGRVMYDLLLQVGRKKKARLAVDLSGGDDGKGAVTIGYPEDF